MGVHNSTSSWEQVPKHMSRGAGGSTHSDHSTCYCHPVYGGRKNWLTLSSLVTNDSEYFHAFLLAVRISSLEKCPLKPFALFEAGHLTKL